MTKSIEAVLSSVLTLCAIVATSVLVYRQFVAQPKMELASASAPVYSAGWNDLLVDAFWVGRRGAAVQVLEFGDFQCPFCRKFHADIETVIAEFDGQVALAFVNLPLIGHAHADMAARAAKCADRQGRFAEIAREFFSDQSKIGVRPWVDYASTAGISDTSSFSSCATSDSTYFEAQAARATAERLMVRGTPTVIVNGWRLATAPSLDTLRRIARDVIAGRAPFPRR